MKSKIQEMMKNKYVFYSTVAITILLTIVNINFISSIMLLTGIENFIRKVVIGCIVIMWLLFIYFAISNINSYKRSKFIVYIISSLIYIIISLFISININNIYNKLKRVSKTSQLYSSSLITKIDNEVNSIDEIGQAKIGVFNDESSIEGYQIPNDIINNKKLKNEIIYYDSYSLLIEALHENEIKYVFMPTNYRIMFQSIDSINEILKDTKIIYTEEKEITKKVITKGQIIDKPFTMLLMGVDSEEEDISSGTFNGDALMLLTFNPKTLNTTIVSIPRDSYVPISCFNRQRKNKITHAAWYGEDCMISTIENFLKVNIDYYFKINFKGVVKLVDALGGVEVDVPFSFCEQDSNRRWGKNTVYVKEGFQKLNGEQALALTRNRKNNSKRCGSEWNGSADNDFVRGQNQQLVIKGILNKAKTIKKIDTVYELLDTISNSMETNMQTSEILSFYNIGKDILSKSKDMKVEDILGFQRLYISGYSKTIMDYSSYDNQGMRSELYNFVPYKGSIKDITEAMLINLDKQNKKLIKKFSFSINRPYEENVIGRGYYNEAELLLLPNFIGKQENVAVQFANSYNLKLNINYIESNNPSHIVGQIIKQTPYAKMDIDYVRDLTIEVVESVKIEEKPDPIPNCSLEENKDNSLCLLLNFVGKKYNYFQNWFEKHNLSIQINTEKIKINSPDFKKEKSGEIFYQSKDEGTSLFDLIGDSLTIKYYEELPEIEKPGNSNEDDSSDDEENPIDAPDISDIIPIE